jgi:arginyl-tRNA synthetase
VATQIAIAALRYFLLKFTRNTVIAFDLQEALSFEGETGPYVQYSAVRARNILRKWEERGEAIPDFAAELSGEALARQLQFEDFWQVLLAASKADSAVENAVSSGEPAHVARYAFQLAQAFSNFYQKYSIIHEEDREKKGVSVVDDGFFPEAVGADGGDSGDPIPAVYVGPRQFRAHGRPAFRNGVIFKDYSELHRTSVFWLAYFLRARSVTLSFGQSHLNSHGG